MKLKEKLKSLGENNPKKFWEIIKGLCNDQNEPNVNPIDFETWDTYFNKLYQPDFTSRAKLEYPVHEVQNIETDAISSILNRTISVDETRRAIKKLKNGKSAGEDNVMNEVLKTAQPYLELPITKLMNLILESEKYPSSWCRNILVTLYKGGGNDDPDNYRGISIGSCLAKLYSTILYHKILEVNDNVGLINNKQIGFLKGFRTSDHLLVIDTIINEVVHKQKKKLFVAFIGLKKAYDKKINRDALIFKGSFSRKGDIFGWKKISDFKLLTLELLKLHHQSLKLKFLKYAAQITTDLKPVSAQNLCPKINVTFVMVV